jgi:hypothetical protein
MATLLQGGLLEEVMRRLCVGLGCCRIDVIS